MLAVLAGTPWLQFNPISLMNANKGVFGVNLGHMWGEIDRMREWAGQFGLCGAKASVKPKIAQSFRFDEAAAGASLHSGSQEYRESAAGAVSGLGVWLSKSKSAAEAAL